MANVLQGWVDFTQNCNYSPVKNTGAALVKDAGTSAKVNFTAPILSKTVEYFLCYQSTDASDGVPQNSEAGGGSGVLRLTVYPPTDDTRVIAATPHRRLVVGVANNVVLTAKCQRTEALEGKTAECTAVTEEAKCKADEGCAWKDGKCEDACAGVAKSNVDNCKGGCELKPFVVGDKVAVGLDCDHVSDGKFTELKTDMLAEKGVKAAVSLTFD